MRIEWHPGLLDSVRLCFGEREEQSRQKGEKGETLWFPVFAQKSGGRITTRVRQMTVPHISAGHVSCDQVYIHVISASAKICKGFRKAFILSDSDSCFLGFHKLLLSRKFHFDFFCYQSERLNPPEILGSWHVLGKLGDLFPQAIQDQDLCTFKNWNEHTLNFSLAVI